VAPNVFVLIFKRTIKNGHKRIPATKLLAKPRVVHYKGIKVYQIKNYDGTIETLPRGSVESCIVKINCHWQHCNKKLQELPTGIYTAGSIFPSDDTIDCVPVIKLH
jgi:hypothetical protein